jgi:hypothetical protein
MVTTLNYLIPKVPIINIPAPADKIKSLFKMTNVSPNNKVFDKDLKSIFL